MLEYPHEEYQHDEFIQTFEDTEDSFFEEDDDNIHDELTNEDYDDDELERRRLAYSDLKKHDKIFNNTYNLGFDYTEEDDIGEPQRVGGPVIKLDSASAEYNLTDPERYSDYVDFSIIQKDINDFIVSNESILLLLGPEPEKKKFTKSEINELFETLRLGLMSTKSINVFISPIHILDAISAAVNLEYKKIFDMLNYENKELLLLELNTKYGFLDTIGRNLKMF